MRAGVARRGYRARPELRTGPGAGSGLSDRARKPWLDRGFRANRSIAVELSRRALRAGADDPRILGRAAVALGRFGDNIDAAVALIDRALALNPSSADGWYWSGWLRVFAGRADLAIEHFQASMRLNPRDGRGFHLAGIGTAHFINGRFAEAAAALRASLDELPSIWDGSTMRGRSSSACGR